MHLESGTIRFMGKGGKERLFQTSEPSVCKLLKQYYEAHKIESQTSGIFLCKSKRRAVYRAAHQDHAEKVYKTSRK